VEQGGVSFDPFNLSGEAPDPQSRLWPQPDPQQKGREGQNLEPSHPSPSPQCMSERDSVSTSPWLSAPEEQNESSNIHHLHCGVEGQAGENPSEGERKSEGKEGERGRIASAPVSPSTTSTFQVRKISSVFTRSVRKNPVNRRRVSYLKEDNEFRGPARDHDISEGENSHHSDQGSTPSFSTDDDFDDEKDKDKKDKDKKAEDKRNSLFKRRSFMSTQKIQKTQKTQKMYAAIHSSDSEDEKEGRKRMKKY